ncbi:MAG: hypothetical protein WC092_08040 [Anaerovoracaceae bacterium]|jgi:hypothetical protein
MSEQENDPITYCAGESPVLQLIDEEGVIRFRNPSDSTKEVCVPKSMLSMLAEDLTKIAKAYALEVSDRKARWNASAIADGRLPETNA